nr:hypothetical protein [Acinetobacter baumannii]
MSGYMLEPALTAGFTSMGLCCTNLSVKAFSAI